MHPTRSCLICCVQRTGSWLLAHSLRDTHRAGYPSDDFDPAERAAHLADWGLDERASAAYLHAVRSRATTANGVMATKMMLIIMKNQRRLCNMVYHILKDHNLTNNNSY